MYVTGKIRQHAAAKEIVSLVEAERESDCSREYQKAHAQKHPRFGNTASDLRPQTRDDLSGEHQNAYHHRDRREPESQPYSDLEMRDHPRNADHVEHELR